MAVTANFSTGTLSLFGDNLDNAITASRNAAVRNALQKSVGAINAVTSSVAIASMLFALCRQYGGKCAA